MQSFHSKDPIRTARAQGELTPNKTYPVDNIAQLE